MKKPTDSSGQAASQGAVRQRLSELEQTAIRATPQQIEAVVVIVFNAATQLQALANGIVRPDIDPRDQLPTARNAATLAKESLEQLLEMLPPEPKKAGNR